MRWASSRTVTRPLWRNVIIPLDLTQLSCPGFTLAAGPPSGFTTNIVSCWGGSPVESSFLSNKLIQKLITKLLATISARVGIHNRLKSRVYTPKFHEFEKFRISSPIFHAVYKFQAKTSQDFQFCAVLSSSCLQSSLTLFGLLGPGSHFLDCSY
jgi:hypothetical protein